MNLWLDDIRDPQAFGCIGYDWVTSIAAAKVALQTGLVERASLDHDLGACDACRDGLTVEEWMEKWGYMAMPACSHIGTGYDLCVWMAETGHWPKHKPVVHSANPVGAMRMEGVIDRYFPREA